MRFLSVTMIALLFSFGCGGGGSSGGDDDDPPIDAPDQPDIDAPPPAVNALGQLCPIMAGGGGTECPAGNDCVALMGVGTNTTTGYCTPNCMNMNSICSTGYTGPAGSMQVCALSAAQGQPPTGCAIICTAQNQCGTGLSCTPVPGQNVMVCVP